MLVFLLILNILHSTHSAVCDFREKVKVQGEVLEEKGIFYFKRGEGIRWDYRGRGRKIFLMARGKMWEYYPAQNFLRTYKVKENFWALFQNPDMLEELSAEVKEKKGKIFVKLKEGGSILIEVRNGVIKKVSFEDTTFEFSSCRYNIPLPSSLFNPTFLPGIRKK